MTERADGLQYVKDVYGHASILLRDAFGYLFSGATFLALLAPWVCVAYDLYGFHIAVDAVAKIAWLLASVGIMLAFVLGHILSALAHVVRGRRIIYRIPPEEQDDELRIERLEKEMQVLLDQPRLHAFFVERYNLLLHTRILYAACFLALFFAQFGLVIFFTAYYSWPNFGLSLGLAIVYLAASKLLFCEVHRYEDRFKTRVELAHKFTHNSTNESKVPCIRIQPEHGTDTQALPE